ncbi:hypothetical protein GALMADRAFT_214086 [Galerina marginata CBS 339.88]|uniref:F-box domain-containing protein n=1 Tax=Galerina marginata (strain CBS 339.88) TaxID=685588 RepID=A0A067STQ4_GALM3|nr:hypothetical protein GALMADRAFT_214086 [Galerina marginata CBS 339.88]
MRNEVTLEAHLPLDLFDLVINELDPEDAQDRFALLNCALVCRSFHYHSSGHLFSTIRIPSDSNPVDRVTFAERIQELYPILEQNETLGQRIKTLIIQTELRFTINPKDRELIQENPFLPLVLSKLSSIRSFTWINRTGTLPWPLFNDSILAGFRKLFSNPSLKSLSLERIEGFPVGLIMRPPNLECLQLVHVDIDDDETDNQLISSRGKLHTMLNHSAPDLSLYISDPPAPSFFSGLRILDVWMRNFNEVRAAWAVMVSAAETLEVLNINDLSHFQYPALIPGPVDLGILKRLHTIKINCTIASGDNVIFPMGICGLLSPPTSPCTIEKVTITIDWIDCGIETEQHRFPDEPAWQSLDEALSRSTLPQLQVVTLDLKLGYTWPEDSSLVLYCASYFNYLTPYIQTLATMVLPTLSRIPTVKTNINVLCYPSRVPYELTT